MYMLKIINRPTTGRMNSNKGCHCHRLFNSIKKELKSSRFFKILSNLKRHSVSNQPVHVYIFVLAMSALFLGISSNLSVYMESTENSASKSVAEEDKEPLLDESRSFSVYKLL